MSKFKLWPTGIFVLLGLNAAIVVTTVVFATTTDSAVVETRPYEKALHWDEEQQVKAQSDRLLWTCEATVVAPSAHATSAVVRLVFTDASGAPITGLAVKARVFHHAHAAQQMSLEALSAAATPGVYAATLTAPKGEFEGGLPLGLWRVSVAATRPSGTTGSDAFEGDRDVMMVIREATP